MLRIGVASSGNNTPSKADLLGKAAQLQVVDERSLEVL